MSASISAAPAKTSTTRRSTGLIVAPDAARSRPRPSARSQAAVASVRPLGLVVAGQPQADDDHGDEHRDRDSAGEQSDPHRPRHY